MLYVSDMKWALFVTFCLVPILKGVDYDDMEHLKAESSGNNSVKGIPAYNGQYPFSVIFYEKGTRETILGPVPSPICSGSVVSARWILTTVTPLGFYKLDSYIVYAGTIKIPLAPDEVSTLSECIYYTDAMVVHPYWQEYRQNNVALVRTSRNMVFGKELGALRIPKHFVPPLDMPLNCSMNVWASIKQNHLTSYYQVTDLAKQTVYFKVANGSKFCPHIITDTTTLCLIQVDPQHLKDVCVINYGAIVQCNCHSVGLYFNGRKDLIAEGCVDAPQMENTAVNLVHFVNWIKQVNDQNITDIKMMREVSVSSKLQFSLNMAFLAVLVFN